MGMLLSGSIIVAASAAPAPQAVEIAPQPVSAAPVARPDVSADPVPVSTRGYVIVDIPAFNRSGAPLGGGLIAGDGDDSSAAQPHRLAAAAPADAATAATRGGAPLDTAAQPSLNDAVIALHDERIMAIRQRIERAREDGGALPDAALRDLRARLTRAEAARTLAADRGASGQACCDAARAAPAAFALESGAAERRPAPPPRARRAGPLQAPPRSPAGLAGQGPSNASDPRAAATAAVPTLPDGGIVAEAAAARTDAPVRQPASAADHAPAPRHADTATAEALQRSHTLLTTARQLLEGDSASGEASVASAADAPIPHAFTPSPAVQLALALLALVLIGAMVRSARLSAPIPATC